jgi:predicted  nucleic acid-binding Zn-ribbon protein
LKEKIQQLIQLQALDKKISEIVDKRKQCPIKIQSLESELNALEKNYQDTESKLSAIQKEHRGYEQEIQDVERGIEKSHVKLESIKSNKEYKAVLKEIEDLRRKQSTVEDMVLRGMEDIENLEIQRHSVEKEKKTLEDKLEQDRALTSQEMEDLDLELHRLEKDREEFSRGVDQDLLKKYAFLRERKNGLAVSPVVSGVCLTCHMGIPPQKYNELIRGNALITCPNCNRIIYWEEDEVYKKVQGESQ